MQVFIRRHGKGLGFIAQLKSWLWIIIEYLIAAHGTNCSCQTAKC